MNEGIYYPSSSIIFLSSQTSTKNLDYIEKLARERFKMAKTGEKVFKVIPKKEPK